MASLSLKNVCKVYPNGFEAVKDFNLDVADKEFIIFVGPSGCGKSTTLRMIAGLEEISDGTLKIDDKVVNDVEPKDRDIAMVFQNYALYPHMTVFENMAFGLKLRKVPKDEIKKLVDFIVSDELLEIGQKESLERLHNELIVKDWFMTLLDVEDYIKTKEGVLVDYEDRKTWAKKALVNISKAGFFSSDRTIAEYNKDIWRL